MAGNRFVEEDLELLIPMAEACFIALERLKLKEAMILEKPEKEKHVKVNKLKSEFIAYISHELKSPLTFIRWSIENLLYGIPDDKKTMIFEKFECIKRNRPERTDLGSDYIL
jgi:signal transduction histidine kinase